MKSYLRWRWHRFWVWEPVCTVTSSSWVGGRVSWRCSCRKSWYINLWPKGRTS